MNRFCLLVLTCFCLSPEISVSQVHLENPLSGYINPINTGHPYDSIFLCRNQVDSIQAINVGTVNLTLRQIDIINQVPLGMPQFAILQNRTQTLKVNKVYRPNTKLFYPVIYSPTIEGPVSATIQCTWDSIGTDGSAKKTLFSTNTLTGIGRLERDTLTPTLANMQSYQGETNSVVDVPVILSRTLPANTLAMGITFEVTYPLSLLDLVKSKASDYDAALSDEVLPHHTNDGAGNETVIFNLKSSIPITKLSPILTLHFTLIGAKDTVVPISISNASFWGQNLQDTLCYILTDTKSTFIHITDSTDISNNFEVVSEGNKSITIVSNNVRTSNISIYIFTLLGAEIASWDGTIAGNFRKIFSMPTSGVYFIKVKIDGKEYIFKKVL